MTDVSRPLVGKGWIATYGAKEDDMQNQFVEKYVLLASERLQFAKPTRHVQSRS